MAFSKVQVLFDAISIKKILGDTLFYGVLVTRYMDLLL